MKRSILAAAIALVAVPALAIAQGTASASVTINATVQSSVTVTSVGSASLTFPTALAPGAAATIAASGAAAGGAYQSQIVTNTPVTVAPASPTVNLVNGANSFAVTLLCAESATADAASPTAIAGCASYVTPAVGTRYYFLGASIALNATSTVPAGAYTGNATLNYTWTTF